MGFHAVTFPEAFAKGYRAGPGFETLIHTTASGHEERLQLRSQDRLRLRADKRFLRDVPLADLHHFYLGRRGAEFGFWVKNLLDFTTAANGKAAPAATDVVLGSGNGTRTIFDLIKVYDPTGPLPYTKKLCAVPSTTLVTVNEALLGTGLYTVNQALRTVTLASPPPLGHVVTAGFEFHVPMRFEASNDRLLAASVVGFGLADLLDIDLVEVLDETELPEFRAFGGCLTLDPMTSDHQVSVDQGEVVLCNPSGADRNLYLQPPRAELAGRCFDVLLKSGATHQLNLRDDAGTLLSGPHGAGTRLRVYLIVSGSTATWLVK